MIAPYEVLTPAFVESLTPAEVIALLWDPCVWLRPDQRIPDYAWRVWLACCGRGFGKTKQNASWLVRRIEQHGNAQRSVILMAPNEPRVRDVQIAALLAESPPWFRLEEYKEGLLAPNGCPIRPFTPEAPDRPRSENAFAAWLTEILDFSPRNIMTAWKNIDFATRRGPYGGQIIIDTTSKPANALIAHVCELNARDPKRYVIQHGTLFDNPTLAPEYVQSILDTYPEGSRTYREEVLGEIFAEAAGALFTQSRLNANRRAEPRARYDLILVGVDPAYSTERGADETGIVLAGIADRDVDVLNDRSGKHTAKEWPAISVGACIDDGAAGVVVETNHGGNTPLELLRVAADFRGVKIRVLPRTTPTSRNEPFPTERTPRTIYVREVYTQTNKIQRAEGPAALDEAGRLHMIGTFPELETELVTYEPGTAKSPNRYDAMMHVVTELADLRRDSRDAPAPRIGAEARDALRARLRRIGGNARVL